MGFENKHLTKINACGYAYLVISNNTLLRKFKKYMQKLNIPHLNRKWDCINCKMISRYETSRILKEKVFKLYKDNSISQIAKKLNEKYATIFMIIKRSKISKQ